MIKIKIIINPNLINKNKIKWQIQQTILNSIYILQIIYNINKNIIL